MGSADDPLDWLDHEQREHPSYRHAFDEQLDALDRELVAAARVVSNLVIPVTQAFLDADAEAASHAIATDDDVDRRCAALEEACFELLARQQPVAGDLRRVVAVVRSVGDVQRSGDLLTHVAESLAWVHPPSMRSELRELIGRLGRAAGDVFDRAVRAWEEHDALAAIELEQLDDGVDLLQKSLLAELYLGGQTVEEAVSLGLICRYYERIADHGVEMGRQVAYVLTGDRPPG